MKITNRKNLPQIIVDAVSNDPYDAGDSDFSATTLIKPSYMVSLEKKHGINETDVSDMLWAMYGSAVHHIIERAASPADLVEQRFFTKVNGKKISAQIDHFRDGVLTDFKLTGAYKVKKALGGLEVDDWEQQLNIQAYLMWLNGYRVDKIQIMAMVRDWTKSKWLQGSWNYEEGYPDQIELIELPLWSTDRQLTFIEHRLMDIERPLPCTRAERWQDPPKYALMKKGGKRALKVSESKDEIMQYANDKNYTTDFEGDITLVDGYYTETRNSPNRRCEGYCHVTDNCEFYKQTYGEKKELPFK